MQSPTPSFLVGFQLEGQVDQVAQDPIGYLRVEYLQQWRYITVSENPLPVFDHPQTEEKKSILLSNSNFLCYNLCLLPHTLPNRIWFLLVYHPNKFLQTGIMSLQRHIFSGPNKLCWSPSNESVFPMSDSQSPQYRGLAGCSSLTPSGYAQTFPIFYVLWNVFQKEWLHNLPVLKRQLQRGWSLSLHKEAHREDKRHQVQVALRDVLSWYAEEIISVRAIVHWNNLTRTW